MDPHVHCHVNQTLHVHATLVLQRQEAAWQQAPWFHDVQGSHSIWSTI